MTTKVPPTRRSLPPSLLKSALASTKPITLSDTPAPSSSSRSRQPLPSASIAPAIRTIAWSPLGTLIAVADARSLRVWNPEKPQVRWSTELKPPASTAAPSGPGAASSGPSFGRTPQAAPQHLTGTERVAWNPAKEAELASVGSDGVARFWDVRNRGMCVGEVKIGGEGFSMSWRPDGEELVIGRKDDTLVRISRNSLTTLAHHPQPVPTNQIAFSNSGTELFITTGDSQVKILDYPSLNVLETLTPHTSSVYCAMPCPRGRHLAIGGSDALVTVWDTSDLSCKHCISDITGPVRSVAFSFDGAYLVAGSDERNDGAPGNPSAPAGGDALNGSDVPEPVPPIAGLSVYHVESGECAYTIPTTAATPCVEWHPSRYLLAYSGEVGGVRILGAGGGAL